MYYASPDIQDRLHEEAVSLKGNVCFQSIHDSLDYTERFIYEVLRLAPPVPNDSKTAVRDDILPGGYKVRAGTMVAWNQNVLGRMSRYWKGNRNKALFFLISLTVMRLQRPPQGGARPLARAPAQWGQTS